jgi:uncharacterized protein (DUF1330 family)
MWIPESAEQIEEAARRGDLRETPSFDAKADLPAPKKNVSLAVDVAAMSTDGGVLLYGIAEDEHKQPTIPQPITLAGAPERVAQIVQTSIAEVPFIEQHPFPCADDASKGYLLVIVPQSARAPHQVIVGGDLRFYGRGDKGNRILTEGDVARLYQRRQGWEQDRDELLTRTVNQQPFGPDQRLAYIHAFARPVATDQAMWERAEAVGGRAALQQALADAAASTGPNSPYSPSLRQGANWSRRGADEWRLSTRVDQDTAARYVVDVHVGLDGHGRMFCGRGGEVLQKDGSLELGRMVLFETIFAGTLASFFAVMAALYRASDYHGSVDVGVRATNLRGGYSGVMQGRDFMYGESAAYHASEYTRHTRVAATELNEPERVAFELLRQFFAATTGVDDFNPFD